MHIGKGIINAERYMDVYSSVEGMLHSGKHGPVPLSQFIFETCILH